MKEIGEKLKEARESIGVTIDEAAVDLKISEDEIEKLEAGSIESFKDIAYLKNFIREYSKYLGLDKEEMADDFNEYLFDYTSKLSLDEIKKEVKAKKEDANKIKSPYTVIPKNEINLQIFTYVAIVLLLLIVSYFIYTLLDKEEADTENIVMNGVVL